MSDFTDVQKQAIVDSQAEILANGVSEGEIADKKVKHFKPDEVIKATETLNSFADTSSPFLGITMNKS